MRDRARIRPRGGTLSICAALAALLAAGLPTAAETPEEIVTELAARCEPWIGPVSLEIESLQYVFDLQGDKQAVELMQGMGSRAQWRVITLSTGLEQLLASPLDYDLSLEQGDGDTLLLIAAKRDRGFRLAIGNGIRGRWRGYFSAGSEKMT